MCVYIYIYIHVCIYIYIYVHHIILHYIILYHRIEARPGGRAGWPPPAHPRTKFSPDLPTKSFPTKIC